MVTITTARMFIRMPSGIPKLMKLYGILRIPPPMMVDITAKIPVKVVSPCCPTKETDVE
jgi:hypothetical protein